MPPTVRLSEGVRLMTDVVLKRRWHTVAEVAEMLGYGETKVRMAIISGDLKSVKDGKLRRILPEWVDEYVALKVAQSDERA
jgi:excisionase family DNA binding protein